MSKRDIKISILSKTNDELNKDLFELKRSLFNLRFRVAAKDVVDVSQFKKNRRKIAKVQTEVNRRAKLGGIDA